MFVKNDLDTEKRFFNGKLGQITGFDKDDDIIFTPAALVTARYLRREARLAERQI
ncbi:MAG: hypothetical protein R3C09_18750 [Pirellulaceae bacterium]